MNVYMCVSVHIYTHFKCMHTLFFFFLIYTHTHFPFLLSFVLKKH